VSTTKGGMTIKRRLRTQGALDGNTYKNMTWKKNNSEFSLSRYTSGIERSEETWSFGVEKWPNLRTRGGATQKRDKSGAE
jgi:hypothetical protein